MEGGACDEEVEKKSTKTRALSGFCRAHFGVPFFFFFEDAMNVYPEF